MKRTSRWGAVVLAMAPAVLLTSAASADVLLEIDLSVENQITITSTDGASMVTASGSDGIGIYLENLFGGSGSLGASSLVGAATFSNAENPTDGTPALFRFGTTDPGLNIYSWSPAATVSFTEGSLAFVGSATWSITAASYANLLAGATSGNIYFPADDAGDLPTAQILGTYSVIPAPGAVALLGLAGLAGSRRRRG